MYDYDLIVIGGGSAGLTAAEFAHFLGKRVALIDKHRLGGDCLWTGCVPSKALIHTARVLGSAGPVNLREASARIYSEINRATSTIERERDNPEYYRAKGIDVHLSPAAFTGPHAIRVGDRERTAKYFLIATGSAPRIPDLPGLEQVPYLTNETIFSSQELPESMIVLGGGPIGCEIAQALARVGVAVALLQQGPRLLPKDEPEASDLILKIFQEEGIRVYLNARAQSVQKTPGGLAVRFVSNGGAAETQAAQSLLVAVGRTPNTAHLGLDTIGVKTTPRGIEHNTRLQTARPHIYVAGDVAGEYLFTHYASVQASTAVRNMFLPLKAAFAPRAVPWATFTDPEIAHVGLMEGQLKKQGAFYRTIQFPYSQIDRAIADNQTRGFVKIFVNRLNRVLGAQIVGARAGELIHELVLAIEYKLSVLQLVSAIHVYPTYAAGLQQALAFYLQESEDSWMTKLARFLARFSSK